MAKQIHIRDAQAADRPYLDEAVLKLCRFIAEESPDPDPYSQGLGRAPTDKLVAYADDILAKPKPFAFVAQQQDKQKDNDILGCCFGYLGPSQLPLCHPDDVAFIALLFVEHTQARQGIGSLLTQHVEAHARTHGIHTLELSFMNANACAEQYWNKRGYRVFRSLSYRSLS